MNREHCLICPISGIQWNNATERTRSWRNTAKCLPTITTIKSDPNKFCRDVNGTVISGSQNLTLQACKIEVQNLLHLMLFSQIRKQSEFAKYLDGKQVANNVKAIAVPGSEQVDKAARALGLHEKFEAAGFEWRLPGCSMCLAMNPDKLVGDEVCASSSNRNFVGRQGSPTGRTILMSPIMVAAAAIEGKVADAREVFSID